MQIGAKKMDKQKTFWEVKICNLSHEYVKNRIKRRNLLLGKMQYVVFSSPDCNLQLVGQTENKGQRSACISSLSLHLFLFCGSEKNFQDRSSTCWHKTWGKHNMKRKQRTRVNGVPALAGLSLAQNLHLFFALRNFS